MEQTAVFLIIGGITIIGYVAFFYLSSILQEGSPLYIRLSYLMNSLVYLWASFLLRTAEQVKHWTIVSPKRKKTPVPQPSAPPASALLRAVETPPASNPPPSRTDGTGPASFPQSDARSSAMTSTQSGVKPTSGPLPPEAAKLAIREQRRLWLRYRDYLGRDITERVEPYHLTWLGTLRGWSVTKSVRRTLASGSVESWRLLDESFQHTPTLERWAKWAWLRGDRW